MKSCENHLILFLSGSSYGGASYGKGQSYGGSSSYGGKFKFCDCYIKEIMEECS